MFDPRQRQKDFSSSLSVQTGSGSHPASYTMGIGVISCAVAEAFDRPQGRAGDEKNRTGEMGQLGAPGKRAHREELSRGRTDFCHQGPGFTSSAPGGANEARNPRSVRTCNSKELTQGHQGHQDIDGPETCCNDDCNDGTGHCSRWPNWKSPRTLIS
jgi:hypothetical protein